MQQTLALIIIAGFLMRIFRQKQKKSISNKEFIFWLIFWLLAGLAILFIKQIDYFVSLFGFGGQGIDALLYLAVIFLFYTVFKLRVHIEKQDKNITKIVREISLKKNG
ncbi:MAG: DUF2304 domain-containing protein [Patescibacteria group bacterium]|nr:DUF2304 domain-containing protein [Patescibacteria group bacterium]